MRIHEKEEQELRRLYEVPLLNKLGFSDTFLRDMMYVSKEILRLDLFLPKTMIAMHRLKLYLGNKRIKLNAARIINVLEE